MTRRIAVVLFIIFAVAAVAPVRNYDFFWHLATGRWIVDQRALPASDPFAVASDRKPWINGEWLFEVVLYATRAIDPGVLRGLFAAAIFTLAFVFAAREGNPHVALALAALGFAGAMPVLDLRPSGVAALFVVLMLSARSIVAKVILTIFWINVHPSALLAPILAKRPLHIAACAAALLVNPYSYRAITAPLSLMSFVSSGAFVNAEWLPSSPVLFPMLYVTIAIAVVAFVTAEKRDWWRIALAVLFAYLAIRHVRNQPLWFAAFPLLVPVRQVQQKLAWAVAAAAMVVALILTPHGLGMMKGRFPMQSVARLKASGFQGNIYNPDQLGGYVIWAFYPERRALTDGRNELYHAFIPEYAKAREDQRAWLTLLRKYRIDLAVDEHRPPLEVIDAVTGRKTMMPAWQAYWPRRDWALIARDDAAMVFARRAAFSAEELKRWEIN